MADRIQHRRDKRATWESVNPVLLEGEIGLVLDDPNLYKVGDGTKKWNDLPYRGFNGTVAQELGTSKEAVMSQKAVTEELSFCTGTINYYERIDYNRSSTALFKYNAYDASCDISYDSADFTPFGKYLYVRSIEVPVDIHSVYRYTITNNGQNDIKLDLLLLNGNDWGKAAFKVVNVTVPKGQSLTYDMRNDFAAFNINPETAVSTYADDVYKGRMAVAFFGYNRDEGKTYYSYNPFNVNIKMSYEYGYLTKGKSYISQNAIDYDIDAVQDFVHPYVGESMDGLGAALTEYTDWCPLAQDMLLTDIKSRPSIPEFQGYHTYVVKNETDGVQYVYAEFYQSGTYHRVNGHYMSYILYDRNGRIVKQGKRFGRLLFTIINGYTLAFSSKYFKSTPHYVDSGMLEKRRVEDYIADYTDGKFRIETYADYHLRTANNDGFNNKFTFSVLEGGRFSLNWNTDTSVTSYIMVNLGAKIQLRKNCYYEWTITNNEDTEMKVLLALVRNNIDYSHGFFAKRLVIIPANTTVTEKIFTGVNGEYLNRGDNHASYDNLMGCPVMVFKGTNNNVALNKGNVIASMRSYLARESAPVNQANGAGFAGNAMTALNAGWMIGAYASDAYFFDMNYSNPNWERGAVKVELVDYHTVKIQNLLDETHVGSSFRGIFWKICYRNFEDLCDTLFVFTCHQSGYTVKLLGEIGIWDYSVNNHTPIHIVRTDGAKTYFNAYDDIKKAIAYPDPVGNKWDAAQLKNGYFYFTCFKYAADGKVALFEDTISLDLEYTKSRVIATELSPSLQKNVTMVSRKVVAWGDSLTAGAGSQTHTNQEQFLAKVKEMGYNIDITGEQQITYPLMLQKLLGTSYNVVNSGVGGENIDDIAARVGANTIYPYQETITLKADGTEVEVANYTNKLKSTWGSANILLQGVANVECWVNGIECVLRWSGSSYSDTAGKYLLKRKTAGGTDIIIHNTTPIITAFTQRNIDTDVAILFCWQNKGYMDDADLVNKLNRIIAFINTDRYIVVGLHSGTKEERSAQETKLQFNYGVKFFNWREYISTYAMSDFGLSPTEEDNTKMTAGSAPSTLLHDSVHLNSVGYGILGIKIYQRMQELGYIH